MKWLIVYDNGIEEVIDAEDFMDLHGKVNSDEVKAAIQLNSNISAESWTPYR